jgi:hypothetical protein
MKARDIISCNLTAYTTGKQAPFKLLSLSRNEENAE